MIDLELDVRPLLRDGGEPFGAIMAAVGRLANGQRLRLYTTFRPEPLFAVLARQGLAGVASPLANGDWEVLFTPIDASESHPEVPETWPDPIFYLDGTTTDSTGSMERILARLGSMSEGQVLFALLEREPMALLAALKALDHAWIGDVDETGVAYRMLIRAGGRA
ncbi:DUF2249 domain-containing protein [Devosia beringensis]|uniref:DUF2249 domain-containing protein n=1 Tax=Devosia beringensis TaxID=2657486 RepID=UPI00186B7FB9|nr:DUF2249 domain-containing protein [Devosia beringensis]